MFCIFLTLELELGGWAPAPIEQGLYGPRTVVEKGNVTVNYLYRIPVV